MADRAFVAGRINHRGMDTHEKNAKSLLFWTITKMRRLRAPIESALHGDRTDITVFEDHLADPDAVIERLLPFDVVCVMRERTPLPRKVIERLPNLKLIASTGSRKNASIDLAAAEAIMGLQWFTRGIGRIRPSNLPGR